MNVKVFLNTLSVRLHTLPIVILYVTEGCNLRCISCSYRDRLPNELSLDEIAQLAESLAKYGLKTIVYSGGEPLLRRDFPRICEIFARHAVRQSLLTNGLLLEKRLNDVAPFLSEIIVSLDGANAETHNSIRGLDSFDQIMKGITSCVSSKPHPSVAIRTVIQKRNFLQLPAMVELAKSLAVDRISFLAADVLSDSFGRASRGSVIPAEELRLNDSEVIEFRRLIVKMVKDHAADFTTNLISTTPDGLFHILQYFEALIGKAEFPRNYCNAPMVSAVITSQGDMLPCYFLPGYGNIRMSTIHKLANSAHAISTRENVKHYTLERCGRCVCTLNMQPLSALLGRL
jgi:MoaA/NifB/PqqE/SkfB family radical SAM enzyme